MRLMYFKESQNFTLDELYDFTGGDEKTGAESLIKALWKKLDGERLTSAGYWLGKTGRGKVVIHFVHNSRVVALDLGRAFYRMFPSPEDVAEVNNANGGRSIVLRRPFLRKEQEGDEDENSSTASPAVVSAGDVARAMDKVEEDFLLPDDEEEVLSLSGRKKEIVESSDSEDDAEDDSNSGGNPKRDIGSNSGSSGGSSKASDEEVTEGQKRKAEGDLTGEPARKKCRSMVFDEGEPVDVNELTAEHVFAAFEAVKDAADKTGVDLAGLM